MNIVLMIILLVIIVILAWALLGGKGDLMGRDDDDSREQEVTLRRRAADKELEKEFPDGTGPRRRRKSDPASEEADTEPDKPFKLPYLADEIIPENSRFRIYRRTLINSEIYAAKSDYNTAISLYEGVKTRIHDIDTRFKIDANIEYLRHFKKIKEEKTKKKEEKARQEFASGDRPSGIPNEIRITLDGSVPSAINIDRIPQSINIGLVDTSRDIEVDAITRDLASRLKGEMSEVKDEISRLKGAPSGAGPGLESGIIQELAGLRERVDTIDAAREAAVAGQGAAGVSVMGPGGDITGGTGFHENATGNAASRSAQKMLHESMQGMANLSRELRGLGESMKEIAESDRSPALNEARFDSGAQVTNETLKDLISKIPGSGPELKQLKQPGSGYGAGAGTPGTGAGPAGGTAGGPGGAGAAGADKTGTGEEEEPDDFELLSDFGKDKYQDELSDDEIFEKILKEDDRIGDKGDFEILGEKKGYQDDIISTSRDGDKRQREDESFYRKLLSTTKRKKKELPILKVSYDFTKLPDEIGLSREKNIIEYAFYKYKPMLEKANTFIQKRKVRDAINYYKVVMSQNIPPEFKAMIRKNLNDLTEYLEKYLTGD